MADRESLAHSDLVGLPSVDSMIRRLKLRTDRRP